MVWLQHQHGPRDRTIQHPQANIWSDEQTHLQQNVVINIVIFFNRYHCRNHWDVDGFSTIVSGEINTEGVGQIGGASVTFWLWDVDLDAGEDRYLDRATISATCSISVAKSLVIFWCGGSTT